MSNMMIQLNYTQAMEQAEQLSKVAGEMKDLAEEEVTKLITDLGSCWEGENAAAYIAKVDILKRNLKKTSEDIEKTATTIRDMATNIYNAEMEAEKVAEVRTFNQ